MSVDRELKGESGAAADKAVALAFEGRRNSIEYQGERLASVCTPWVTVGGLVSVTIAPADYFVNAASYYQIGIFLTSHRLSWLVPFLFGLVFGLKRT